MMERAITLGYEPVKTIWKSITGQFQDMDQDLNIYPFQNLPTYIPSVPEIENDEFNDENSQTLVKENELGIQIPTIITISEAISKLKKYILEIRKREQEFEKKELEDLKNFLQRKNDEK